MHLRQNGFAVILSWYGTGERQACMAKNREKPAKGPRRTRNGWGRSRADQTQIHQYWTIDRVSGDADV